MLDWFQLYSANSANLIQKSKNTNVVIILPGMLDSLSLVDTRGGPGPADAVSGIVTSSCVTPSISTTLLGRT